MSHCHLLGFNTAQLATLGSKHASPIHAHWPAPNQTKHAVFCSILCDVSGKILPGFISGQNRLQSPGRSQTWRWSTSAVLRRLIQWQMFCVLVAVIHVYPAAAEISVERLFPPVITVGSPVQVTAEGKFDSWPVQIWCDRPDVTITPETDSGKLSVTVASDGQPGIAWVRLFDDASASGLVPLLIETVAISMEVEPNNGLGDATRIDLPAVCGGKLEKNGDLDCFVVAATAGQTMVASVMANRVLDAPMDSVLQLVDKSGNVLAQSDDARGIDPRIVFDVPRDGDYVLRLFAFPLVPNSTIGFAGGAEYVYRMHVTTGPLIEHVLPLVKTAPLLNAVPLPESTPSSDSPDATAERSSPTLVGWNLPASPAIIEVAPTAISPTLLFSPGALGWHPQFVDRSTRGAILVDATAHVDESEASSAEVSSKPVIEVPSVPAIVSGRIERAGQVISLQVPVVGGVKYRATLNSQASDLKLDGVITVIEPETDKQLARNDDASGAVRDSTIDFTPAGKGEAKTVEIQITDLVGGFGLDHGFSLMVGPISPTLELTVAAGQFKVVTGTSVEIPVTLAWRDGFADAFEVRAIDLPAGVTAAAVVADAKEKPKEVKLKLEAAGGDAAKLFQGPIRIVAIRQPPADGGEANHQAAMASSVAEIAVATHEPRKRFKTTSLWLTVAGK